METTPNKKRNGKASRKRQVAETPIDPLTIDYFGGCPVCGKHNGYVNVDRAHFFLCRRHKTCWCAGENLFSTWRDENPALWKRRYRMLRRHYQLVEPLYPPPDETQREG